MLGTPTPLHSLNSRHVNDNANTSSQSDEVAFPLSRAGTWGERDAVPPVSHEEAAQDFETLHREISQISHQRSRSGASTIRTKSRLSLAPTNRTKSAREPTRTRTTDSTTSDRESVLNRESRDDEDFELGGFLKEGHFEKRTEAGDSAKKVGVIFKNLTVKGVGATAVFVKDLPQAMLGTFGPDFYRLMCRFVPRLRFGRKPPTRILLNDFTGIVKDGEMMLILGRPGSGCTTFLKAIANDRASYAEVLGDVTYGGIPAEKQRRSYKGEVIYNAEDDQHLPSLTVWQTLKFSLMNKTRKHHTSDIPVLINALLRMFGITHTAGTLVGNEFVRGISGGERKRVSIAETLATKSTVVCWDNSTRGLDASTALDYARSLRVMTDVSNRTTLVNLYQAGQQIYDLMDKVLVIEEGRCIFQGAANEAKAYFEGLGFFCPHKQTTADFLTSIGDANERQFQAGRENEAPKTAKELEEAYRHSKYFKNVLTEVADYEQQLHESEHADAREFQSAVGETKSKHVSKSSSYTVSFSRQVWACTIREFWLLWGDKTTLYTKAFIIVSNGLIVGSLFYSESLDSSGAFSRGGALFMSIVFLGWLQLSELMKAVSGRTVISRHNDYAFYRPSAVAIARVILDFPVLLIEVIVYGVLMYFMSNLDVNVSKFFIFELFIYLTTICLTAMYRMFAALSPTIDDAVRYAGIAFILLVLYTGYVIPKPQLIQRYIWFGWLYYVDPLSYSFEGVLTNEFGGRDLRCAPSQLFPQGPEARPPYQACSLSGSGFGRTEIPGSQYLQSNYQYTRSHLWRNFGVVIAFTVLYILITVVASELFSFTASSGGALVFKRSKKAKKMLKQDAEADDEEKLKERRTSSTSIQTPDSNNNQAEFSQISKQGSIFTWKNVEYTVPYQGGHRKLVNDVHGYVKPGVMIALMGASGAGKTTLLNTLAQRQSTGVVSGEMLVDGRSLGQDFQRGTGFCEQMDLHDGTQTIREALVFSALLRQNRSTPEKEKFDYVEKIIDLLELQNIEDALIMSLGVEQRKRLTIGVELAAKPSLLLFLDEPTSGLDSQSAFSIVRFLRKLADAGQAIICTIHQPSSTLIQQFDRILALNERGSTYYFGKIGDNGSIVTRYFADRGTVCPPEKNVAEFILETAAKGGTRGINGKRLDWTREWQESEENKELLAEIESFKTERQKLPPPEAKTLHEFAAPLWLQIVALTKRMFLQQWREPSYLYGKLFVSVMVGLFNGFTFWQLGNTITYLQDRLFSPFFIIVIAPTVLNAILPKFYMNRALWEAREYPSRIYGWVAFCTSQVVSELPAAIVGGVVYWLCWYYPSGLPTDSSTAGYVFLMTLLYFLFQASCGQWICAFAPSFTVISNVLPFFLVIFSLFNGVFRPYDQLPAFWRFWIYYANPSTYCKYFLCPCPRKVRLQP